MRTRRGNPTSIKNLKRTSLLDTISAEFNNPQRNEEGEWEYLNSEGVLLSDYVDEVSDEANRLDAIGAVYQRADRIITGDTELGVTITSSREMQAPSVTDGKDIIINGNLINDVSDDTIMGLNGLNYHEMAHVLFSPRAGSGLSRYVMDNKMLKAFNVLEEGRIERLLTTLYPTTTLTLEAMVSDILLSDVENIGAQFPTLTGRTYMPLEVRQAVADKFIEAVGLDVAKQVHGIVHAYRALSFPTDFDKAKELISQMANLMGLDDEPKAEFPQPTGGHGDREIPERGKPKSGKQQAELQNRAPNGEVEQLDDKPNDNFDVGAGTTDNGKVYDGEDRKLSEVEQKLSEALAKRINEIKSDKRIERDLRETRKAIVGSTDVSVKLSRGSVTDMAISPESKQYATRFGRELERLVRDQDPKWDTHLPSGKLNISRTMSPDVNAIGEMFDVWNTGNDNTEIEACVLIDNSGSMWGQMRTVCEQAWIIKRGIESINGSVTVLSFNHESKIIYESDEKAKPNSFRYVPNTGWTNPYRGLMESERILKATEKPNKILFIVTDGTWENRADNDKVIKRMKDNGVLTVVVYLSNGMESMADVLREVRNGNEYWIRTLKELAHGADIFKHVSEPKHTLALANEVVKATITNNRKRVA